MSDATVQNLSPREALDRLAAGNVRFVESLSEHPNQDAARRASLVSGQNPFAVIFGCSDSRLAAEIIFDVGLGDMFVVRTAGHVIDDTVLGSLEYSVNVLETPVIVVLGHDSCGAVLATQESIDTGNMPGGFVRDLVERITPSVLQARREGQHDTHASVVEHVKQTAGRLVDSSKAISQAVEEGRVAVVGMAYHLDNGAVSIVSQHGNLE